MIRRTLARLADRVLGYRCALGCGERVFDKNLEEHCAREHAGENFLGNPAIRTSDVSWPEDAS